MRGILAFALAATLVGCGASRDEADSATQARAPIVDVPAPRNTAPINSRSRYKVGSPYTIAGKRYVPVERFRHVETGRASWYGPGFHGRKTANGEIFDQHAMTAAHKTLQLPSIVRVTNIGNGRRAILRVNDRGPYHGDRIIDLSEAGAIALGFKRYGTAMVRVEVMEDASREVASKAQAGASVSALERIRARVAGDDSHRIESGPAFAPIGRDVGNASVTEGLAFVQAGAFGEIANARKLAAALRPYGAADITPSFEGQQRVYRVRLGPYANVQDAERALADLSANGLPRAHVVVIQ
jgi:rare lipoprotein A